jgi:hypothetical protein
MTNKSMDILFDKFWVDRGAETLRRSIDNPASRTSWDDLVTTVGRLGFIRPLAVFPVLYMDDDMAVFRFPPLASNIAMTKVE